MTDEYKSWDKTKISISNIRSDIHRLGLSGKITNLLLKSGVFYTAQIDKMTEYELMRIDGISSITVEKIKQANDYYRWNINLNRKIQTIEELKSLIEQLPEKKEILQVRMSELNFHVSIHIAFHLSKVRTIEDILHLSIFDLFNIKGIGMRKCIEIIDSILEIVALYDAKITESINFQQPDLLDKSLYTQSNLTFPEVFTMLLYATKPRNREILFEYYCTYHAKYGSYSKLAEKYALSKERIRQICSKTLRSFRFHRRKSCLMTYLNAVWKEKVYNFVSANGGYVTILEIEQEFANDLPEIYFLQNEILEIKNIWTNALLKDEQYYYLPFLSGEMVKNIEQFISEEIKKFEWGIDLTKFVEIIENKLPQSKFLSNRSCEIISGIIKKFDLLEVTGNEVRLAMRRKK